MSAVPPEIKKQEDHDVPESLICDLDNDLVDYVVFDIVSGHSVSLRGRNVMCYIRPRNVIDTHRYTVVRRNMFVMEFVKYELLKTEGM